ncbi:hypothetical protein [Actinokineospora sp.]|uniref:hypothetical protein n=1 Tax=Actinokineospora sp. TaxID=1872133 RepID=UPI004037FC7A
MAIALAFVGSAVAVGQPSEQAPTAVAPMRTPGDTTKITLISSTVADGWKYDYYRNTAYPCSITGYQTFTLGTKVGSSPTARKPLWVYLHGGGIGYFDPSGSPQPNTKHMTEEPADYQRTKLQTGALTQDIARSSDGFRLLAVSMCNRDIYAGPDIADPNNRNTTPDGKIRTVNGFFATKAAVQFAHTRFPTGDYFLYGTSAGAFGTFHVAWGLQQQGLRPAGLVADSGVLNKAWLQAQVDLGLCGQSAEAQAIIKRRMHPDIDAEGNDPDQLVSTGRLTVPILALWSINDQVLCGSRPMSCPLRNGSTPTMGAVDCLHEPLRAAIAAQGGASKSKTMRLCVDKPSTPGLACDLHTPTQFAGAVNTLPGQPPNFNSAVTDWIAARLQD